MVGGTLWLGTLFGWGHTVIEDTDEIGDTIELGPLYG